MTIMKQARGALLAFGLAVTAMPAFAQAPVEVTPQVVADALKAAGYTAEIHAPDDGYGPWVASFSDQVKAKFDIRFEGCDEEGDFCRAITFAAGFDFGDKAEPIDMDKINAWNTENWGKASRDNEIGMWISHEIDIGGGLTTDQIESAVIFFEDQLITFTQYINWQAN